MSTVQDQTEGLQAAERVELKLLDRIFEGKWAPGDFETEENLSKEMAISRTPIREAIKTLADAYILERFPYRGARVRVPSLEELQEMETIRRRSEPTAASRVASLTPRLRTEPVADLQELHQRMVDSHAAFDRLDFVKLDTRFHCALMDSAGAKVMSRFLKKVIQAVVASGFQRLTQESMLSILHEHVRIIDAISNGKPALAYKAMKVHLLNASQRRESEGPYAFPSR